MGFFKWFKSVKEAQVRLKREILHEVKEIKSLLELSLIKTSKRTSKVK